MTDAPRNGRAKPIDGQPTTYRGLYDMAGWWEWSEEAETKSLPSFAPFIQPGDLVFDIGANRGRKTWIFRKLGAKVVAVEPLFAFGYEFVPEFWWKFEQDAKVIPVARAISRHRTAIIHINKFMPYVSSIDKAWMTESAHSPKNKQPYYKPKSLIKRTVAAITLDGLMGIYGIPKFMKVDVEGAENEVIQTLSVPVPALNMEFHQDWLPIEAMKHMGGLGHYVWNYCLGTFPDFIAPHWMHRADLIAYMRKHLTEKGDGSWGDIYGRLD